ncbi:MAG: ABC transporter ATP-binding protein [Sulfobacillus thermosulfidooxidans]|uniref:Dipeptide/oligopeptide/nickel ABC transporter ATP-binding protein n=1 Tax=Sulfobacillus thermotolerans TaxID=338644 RepID=A0ABM6RPZ8_9FIRM|nr:ABC transporter ATP-binding protein [Sulfobacillus sp. hq2]AUW93432.1 dipeptide/oligopeptide/nickel ABC transporter ATP-binding protein [Sulfobacillus thermotolerans]MCY0908822.1 ABC transporter ATP-binding protein [Sulfobacillus thermotolerans]POB10666.1 dipeptide/oligopeptide/nickel ABC transporter ATP-binding protein [Sulfobacillus sp. hq2]PSR37648.1 MAG: ABC transporter ATP-binding protein [Sulfobacillus thermosulfidooxidans]
MTEALVVDSLHVSYITQSGLVPALRNVSLSIASNEILGLVGESGSGKSTMAQAVMRLLKPDVATVDGRILVDGQDLYQLTPEELRLTRWRKIAMVFQSSMNALNPVLSIQEHFADTMEAHIPGITRDEILKRTADLLEQVRLDPAVARSYAHELSGGMRQRVVIALSLALDPSVLIMDEPTTALDVVVQRSILDEIAALQKQRQLAVLFISHDFNLVSGLANRIAVMYAGEIMEITDRGMALEDAREHHPYTQGLMRAAPRLVGTKVSIEGIPGEPPDMTQLGPGCPFFDRCPERLPMCRTTPLPSKSGRVYIRCHAMPDPVVEKVKRP